jgi:hypothetical protein
VGSAASAVVDASTTGTYPFVVANQTGNTGSYQIGIYRAGVYFVRMRCDGREVGWQKAAIVD